MENIVFITAVFLVFLFGTYLMKRLDRFLDENEKRRNEEVELKGPSSVKLSGDLPLMEIDREIDKFRRIHPNFEIILRSEDSGDP